MTHRNIPQWMKDAKYHFCAACGSEDDLQYHHLVPVSLGGENSPSNIIVLCAACHQKWHKQGGRTNHNYLVKDGIAKAKANGVKMGRKPRSDESDILRTIAEKSTQFNEGSLITEGEIMDELNLRPTQYSKYKRRLFAAMEYDKWPYDWEKPVQVRWMPMYERKIKRLRGDAV